MKNIKKMLKSMWNTNNLFKNNGKIIKKIINKRRKLSRKKC